MSKQLERSASPPRRVQIEFAESEIDEIDHLIDKCDLRTKKELFNSALTILRWAVRQVEGGCEIAAIDRDRQQFFVLNMPILDAAHRSKKKGMQDSKQVPDLKAGSLKDQPKRSLAGA